MTKAETLEKEKQEKTRDFQKDIMINKYKLDEECLSHSSLYSAYALAQADAKAELAKAKDHLELVTSEVNLEIRKELSDSGQKVTEATIASYLVIDKRVKNAKAEVREAEEVYSRLSVAVSAMETRRSELDNLVKLYCAGYFSTVGGAGKNNINEQTSNDVRKNLNK